MAPHEKLHALLHGGPGDGRAVEYGNPMPTVLVIAEYVPAGDAQQPGLKYYDYRQRPRAQHADGRAYGPYHFDYQEKPHAGTPPDHRQRCAEEPGGAGPGS